MALARSIPPEDDGRSADDPALALSRATLCCGWPEEEAAEAPLAAASLAAGAELVLSLAGTGLAGEVVAGAAVGVADVAADAAGCSSSAGPVSQGHTDSSAMSLEG